VLLADISEAMWEIKVYVGWWRRQGREDLAARAAQMVVRLDNSVTVREQINES
jgi:hypothetical protein